MTVVAPAGTGPADPDPGGADRAARMAAAAALLLERCHFPDAGAGPVDLAVSGGPDSVALMPRTD